MAEFVEISQRLSACPCSVELDAAVTTACSSAHLNFRKSDQRCRKVQSTFAKHWSYLIGATIWTRSWRFTHRPGSDSFPLWCGASRSIVSLLETLHVLALFLDAFDRAFVRKERSWVITAWLCALPTDTPRDADRCRQHLAKNDPL